MSNKRWLRTALIGWLCIPLIPALAAQGEMGTGIPAQVGLYSNATGTSTIVWSLSDVSLPFPDGCLRIILSPATMGMDAYKIAISAILLARTTGKRVRFYAHAPRDGGCGVDYLELSP